MKAYVITETWKPIRTPVGEGVRWIVRERLTENKRDHILLRLVGEKKLKRHEERL